MIASLHRISAMALRYAYILRRSWPRLLELFYWPTVQMILWGLISRFFQTQTDGEISTTILATLLAAVLLWDVMFRSHLGIALVYFEEIYARNLGHLYISPLRPYEHVLSLLVISFIRTIIGISVAAVLAWLLYDFALTDLGLSLLGFYLALSMMGWSLGLVVAALVMRFGLGAESLAWVLVFALAPLSAVYYPLSILPEWLQFPASLLPSTQVFEGMRAVFTQDLFPFQSLILSLGLATLYLSLAVMFYLRTVMVARRNGLLMQGGE
jgi:ABC-2 type transport system permease protein